MIVAASLRMKQLILLLLLVTLSFSVFAQFPLGSKVADIKSYFAGNIPYASVQEFKTKAGENAICFTKVKVVGDYTFYFDNNGKCSSYVVTYDENELKELMVRFDAQFCRMQEMQWMAHDETFDVMLVPAKPGENFFSIVYKPKTTSVLRNSFAAN